MFCTDQQLVQKDEEIAELKSRLKKMTDSVQTSTGERLQIRYTDALKECADQQLVQKDEEIAELKSRLKKMTDLVQISTGERLQIRYTDALKELREKNRYIRELKEELNGAPKSSGRRSPTNYVPYNQQTCRVS